MATREEAANYRRQLDKAISHAPELPPSGPEAPRTTGPTPQDLDRASGVGDRTRPAAQQRRVHETWYR